MRFFDNSAINRIYLHSALQSMASNAGGVFVYIYLLKAGLTLPLVFLTIGCLMVSRIVIRFCVVPVIKRIGLRNGVILGTLVEGVSYLMLAHVDGLGVWLVGYISVASLGTAFYWTCYHAIVARQGDVEKRGAQVSAREAIFAVTAIIGPLFGGLVLTFEGPFWAFAFAAVFCAFSTLPLLSSERLSVEPEAQLDPHSRFYASGLAFSDGLVAASVNFMWRIFLFQTLGESFENFGGALAVAGLCGAFMGLVAGRVFDLGHHKRSLQMGALAGACVVIAQVLGYHTVWSAILATIISAIGLPLYMSALMSPFYNLAKASACSFRFSVAGENGFDSGAGLGCAAAALFSWLELPATWPLLIGLFGCVNIYILLLRLSTSQALA
ncbi:MAG: MFS transporter [Pseudomonadota bacterium]|nr:MFS transporter [Pseudomonadota bacterium]